jgi:ribosome-associated translation inhibitor RaiA
VLAAQACHRELQVMSTLSGEQVEPEVDRVLGIPRRGAIASLAPSGSDRRELNRHTTHVLAGRSRHAGPQEIPAFTPLGGSKHDGAMHALRTAMTSYIAVNFQRIDRNASIESAIHRWVARFEAMRFEVRRAVATVEAAGRSRTAVKLTVVLADGASRTVTTARTDPYVAVSDAFRRVRQQLLAAPQGRLVA